METLQVICPATEEVILSCQSSQALLFWTSKRYMYGFEVPCNYDDTVWIECFQTIDKTGNATQVPFDYQH
jgi:hypothetical protein